ncbi:hypothetical protein PybrP1_000968 [[Pythium] brassicae (nom. inval.)]|nr:hypothetical protein PybrP1_000968 [[Pythium] brassicae (nom. inval.)]
MTKSATTAALETQHQIRANAAELQDYFSDLYSWEKTVERDEEARRQAKAARQPSAGGATAAAPVRSAPTPAAHTYDRGYYKWAKFDVEAALKEADEDGHVTKSAVAASSSREEIEREEGNAHYKRGDFVAAIKCYTRCLGYDSRNAVVLSNRAMAYLKNREFAKAEDDCNLAIQVDPSHLKSLSRRATARNALGKHRLALLDFERAAALDPKSRQLQNQIASTKELLRAAIKRAPTQRGKLLIEVIDDEPKEVKRPVKLPVEPAAGSVVREDEPEDKENARANTLTEPEKIELPAAVATSKKPANALGGTPPPPPPTPSVPAASRASAALLVPKLPKKAPATSYEFGRVWKSLALKGDQEHRGRLLASRATYLRAIRPATLRTVFKNSIEPEIVCEAFHVFRHAVLASPLSSTDSDARASATAFVLEFAQELAKVPRFSMAVMFLSASEKEDVAWVLDALHARAEQQANATEAQQIAALKTVYAVK